MALCLVAYSHHPPVGALFPPWPDHAQPTPRQSVPRVYRLRHPARALPYRRAQPQRAVLPADESGDARLGKDQRAIGRDGGSIVGVSYLIASHSHSPAGYPCRAVSLVLMPSIDPQRSPLMAERPFFLCRAINSLRIMLYISRPLMSKLE